MINFENRLSSLKDRRQGSTERVKFESAIDYEVNREMDFREKEDMKI